ncbi:hypothetical protein [Streptomyces genisteinicus]|uniref:Tetratricopeptide repeat protein n=1 Tax=Streptomyces genisteinicus TaxID=2768068 RepID=A0A7H0HNS4_9ACTN|nr:hypothetical protein [Streptomyces genisteinicus]QNP62190.1 hypothetical protein IAG43_04090 [Streptomyces genisteinicus]
MTDQQQSPADAVTTRIGQAAMLLHGGDREEARNRLAELWSEIADSGDALDRCTLAHYLADAQDDPADELAWDLRALAAAEGVERTGGGTPAVRALFPSLHLNLAADYVRLSRPAAARDHLARARAATGALADDGYGHDVRAAIDRLSRTLGPA